MVINYHRLLKTIIVYFENQLPENNVHEMSIEANLLKSWNDKIKTDFKIQIKAFIR